MPLARNTTVIARSEATKQSPTLSHQSGEQASKGSGFPFQVLASTQSRHCEERSDEAIPLYIVISKLERLTRRCGLSTTIPHAADAFIPLTSKKNSRTYSAPEGRPFGRKKIIKKIFLPSFYKQIFSSASPLHFERMSEGQVRRRRCRAKRDG